MNIMKKEFITYEQAVALKDLGFDEPCFGFYNHQGQLILMTQEDENSIQVYKNSYVKLGKQYAAPLKSQIFRWFREKYNMHRNCELISSGWLYKTCNLKEYTIEHNVLVGKFKTYEEAEQACLDKLIEIVKNK